MVNKNKANKRNRLYILIVLVIIIAILLLVIFIPRESPPVKDNNPSDEKIFCKPEQRGVEFCYELYAPVCGWAYEEVICKNRPCVKEFSNDCFACADKNVEYYTQGECLQ
jgi:hypothetical protein